MHRLLLFTLLLAACGSPTPSRHITGYAGFYSWKTTFAPTPEEWSTLHHTNSKYLYIKYLDVDIDKSNHPTPLSITQWSGGTIPDSLQIIPVVFIVNRVFTEATTDDLENLAQNIATKIKSITPAGIPIAEVQFDCDWTASTSQAYFDFLQSFRAQWPGITLSATIRLNQVKHRTKTGIPPVDRGALMLYNFDNPSKPTVKNSILDVATAEQYLKNPTPYPLPLDIALPLFGWGLHFRGNDFQGFLHDWRSDYADNSNYLTRIDKNIYRVKVDTTVEETYFRPGDWIRLEDAPLDQIATTLSLALPVLPNDTCRIPFFDLNWKNLKYYDPEALLHLAQMDH